jgi:hypothetical protein
MSAVCTSGSEGVYSITASSTACFTRSAALEQVLVFPSISRSPGMIGIGEVNAVGQRGVRSAPELVEECQPRNGEVFLLAALQCIEIKLRNDRVPEHNPTSRMIPWLTVARCLTKQPLPGDRAAPEIPIGC